MSGGTVAITDTQIAKNRRKKWARHIITTGAACSVQLPSRKVKVGGFESTSSDLGVSFLLLRPVPEVHEQDDGEKQSEDGVLLPHAGRSRRGFRWEQEFSECLLSYQSRFKDLQLSQTGWSPLGNGFSHLWQ